MTAIELFCSIIKEGMDLEDDQIYLWDQKINIPPDNRLYVAVSVLNCKPYSLIRSYQDVGDDFSETITTNMLANVNVDIMSRGKDARDRKEEVILALGSTYSTMVQERNAMRIGRISNSFVNLSQLEGSAIPYRFNIGVSLQYKVSKTKAVDYYDTFTDTVTTEA